MQHTIAAIFENYQQAQLAVDDLVAAGFPRDDARLSRNQDGGDSDTAGGRDDDSMMSGIKNFFNNVFGVGSNRSDVDLYSEAVLRGNYVVTLSVEDEDLIDRATEILDRYDPVDINDHAERWHGSNLTGAPQSAMSAGSGARQSMDSGAMQSGGGAGMMQSSSTSGGSAMPFSHSAGAGAQQSADASDAGTMQSASGAGTSYGTGRDFTGQQVGRRGEPVQGGLQADALQSGAQAGSQQRGDMDQTAIPLIREELNVGKRAVQRGGVRVFQRLVETPVQASIDLRDERVTVQRRPVDQPATAAQLDTFQEGSFEVRETAEVPVVQKVARVMEEVVLGKAVTERQEQINDTVRSTEVEVEQLQGGSGATAGASGDDAYFRQHWTSNYSGLGGNYDEYAPAYRFGASLVGSEQFRSRSWAEAEPELRRSWEAENSGSPWEKMKNAVRHGWEKITS